MLFDEIFQVPKQNICSDRFIRVKIFLEMLKKQPDEDLHPRHDEKMSQLYPLFPLEMSKAKNLDNLSPNAKSKILNLFKLHERNENLPPDENIVEENEGEPFAKGDQCIIKDPTLKRMAHQYAIALISQLGKR